MAHYVQIPKDLNDIKQKFMFGLTKRQVVSFGIGGVMGIPLFFLSCLKAVSACYIQSAFQYIRKD